MEEADDSCLAELQYNVCGCLAWSLRLTSLIQEYYKCSFALAIQFVDDYRLVAAAVLVAAAAAVWVAAAAVEAATHAAVFSSHSISGDRQIYTFFIITLKVSTPVECSKVATENSGLTDVLGNLSATGSSTNFATVFSPTDLVVHDVEDSDSDDE